MCQRSQKDRPPAYAKQIRRVKPTASIPLENSCARPFGKTSTSSVESLRVGRVFFAAMFGGSLSASDPPKAIPIGQQPGLRCRVLHCALRSLSQAGGTFPPLLGKWTCSIRSCQSGPLPGWSQNLSVGLSSRI